MMLHAALLVLGVLAADADSVLKRGKPIPPGATATIDSILANPTRYADSKQVVVIDGMVIRSCTAMGCWMQLADGPDGRGVRVDFHNGGFVIPLGAAGMKARAQGVVTVEVLTAEDAAHLEGEGARIEKNAKGEPIEVGLEATGVELYYVD